MAFPTNFLSAATMKEVRGRVHAQLRGNIAHLSCVRFAFFTVTHRDANISCALSESFKSRHCLFSFQKALEASVG